MRTNIKADYQLSITILIAMFTRMAHIRIWGYFERAILLLFVKTVLFPNSVKLTMSMMLHLLYFTKQELCVLVELDILIGCIFSL